MLFFLMSYHSLPSSSQANTAANARQPRMSQPHVRREKLFFLCCFAVLKYRLPM